MNSRPNTSGRMASNIKGDLLADMIFQATPRPSTSAAVLGMRRPNPLGVTPRRPRTRGEDRGGRSKIRIGRRPWTSRSSGKQPQGTASSRAHSNIDTSVIRRREQEREARADHIYETRLKEKEAAEKARLVRQKVRAERRARSASERERYRYSRAPKNVVRAEAPSSRPDTAGTEDSFVERFNTAWLYGRDKSRRTSSAHRSTNNHDHYHYEQRNDANHSTAEIDYSNETTYRSDGFPREPFRDGRSALDDLGLCRDGQGMSRASDWYPGHPPKAGPTFPAAFEFRGMNHGESIEQLNHTLNQMLTKWREKRKQKKLAKEDKSLPEDTRAKNDHLYATLDVLEEGLAELRVWDTVMSQITHNSLLCRSKPLASLLDRIRQNYAGYFSSFNFICVEIRRRMKLDWILDSLQHKKEETEDLARERISKLREELNKEQNLSLKFSQELQQVKDSVDRNQSQVFGQVKMHEEPTWDWDILLDELIPYSDKKEERTRLASEFDKRMRKVRQDLRARKAEELLDLPKEQRENSSLTSEIAELSGNIANALGKTKARVPIHSVENGDKVRGQLICTSQYYRFTLGADDRGILLRLSQTPSGDRHNYIEITLNKDAPPSRLQSAFSISTHDAGEAVLDLKNGQMEQGDWFMRVLGKGRISKQFDFEFRIIPQMLSSVYEIEDIADDLEAQQEWQRAVAGKMAMLDKLLTDGMELSSSHTRHHTGQGVMTTLDGGATENRPKVETRDIGTQWEPQNTGPIQAIDDDDMNNEDGQRGRGGKGLKKLFKHPAPDPSKLKVMETKKILQVISQIYKDKIEADRLDDQNHTPHSSMWDFVYEFFKSRYGLPRLSEVYLREMIYSIENKHKRILRVAIFAQFNHIITPHLSQHDLDYYLKAFSLVVQLCAKAKIVLPDYTEECLIPKEIGHKVANTMLSSHSTTYSSKILSHIDRKFSTVRHKEMMIDVDNMLAHLMASEMSYRRRHEQELFKIFDMADPHKRGTIKFPQFALVMRSCAPWFSDFELFLLYREAIIASKLVDSVSLEGFKEVGIRYDVCEDPEEKKVDDNTKKNDEKKNVLPNSATAGSAFMLGTTSGSSTKSLRELHYTANFLPLPLMSAAMIDKLPVSAKRRQSLAVQSDSKKKDEIIMKESLDSLVLSWDCLETNIMKQLTFLKLHHSEEMDQVYLWLEELHTALQSTEQTTAISKGWEALRSLSSAMVDALISLKPESIFAGHSSYHPLMGDVANANGVDYSATLASLSQAHAPKQSSSHIVGSQPGRKPSLISARNQEGGA